MAPDSATVHGQDEIVTIGRLAPGHVKSVEVSGSAADRHGKSGPARLILRSATAQPVVQSRDDDK